MTKRAMPTHLHCNDIHEVVVIILHKVKLSGKLMTISYVVMLLCTCIERVKSTVWGAMSFPLSPTM